MAISSELHNTVTFVNRCEFEQPVCVCAVTTPSLGAQRSSHIRRIHQALRALCAPTSSPSLRTLHGASASRCRCSHSSRQPHLPRLCSPLLSAAMTSAKDANGPLKAAQPPQEQVGRTREADHGGCLCQSVVFYYI